MSEDIFNGPTVGVTRYFGGRTRGVCYQINVGSDHASLTESECVDLCLCLLTDILKGAL